MAKNLPSRIVHCRMPIETIIGCYDVFELVGGRDPTNLATSSIVADVLKGFIRGMQAKGTIPEWSQAELEKKYIEIFGDESAMIFADADYTPAESQVLRSTGHSTVEQSLESEEESADPEAQKEIRAALENQLLSKVATQTLEVRDIDPPKPAKNPSMRLDMRNCIPLDTLASMSPEDEFILQCTNLEHLEALDPKQRERLKAVVRFVYSNLSQSQWGGERAEKMIVELLENPNLMVVN